MPANLGMIALGKINQLEKRIKKLELALEEIKEQVREEDIRAIEESKGVI